jgi:hypothetical protein
VRAAEISSGFTHPASLLHLAAGRAGLGAARRRKLWMNDDGPILEEAEGKLRGQLADLRIEHQDLDAAIAALESKPRPDMIQIARLKKKKLRLRDEITRLDDQLTPDIIA